MKRRIEFNACRPFEIVGIEESRLEGDEDLSDELFRILTRCLYTSDLEELAALFHDYCKEGCPSPYGELS